MRAANGLGRRPFCLPGSSVLPADFGATLVGVGLDLEGGVG